VLDETGGRVILRELALRDRDFAPVDAEQDRARRGRAFIDDENTVHVEPPSRASLSCFDRRDQRSLIAPHASAMKRFAACPL
jgi:hypothetical protein